MKANRVFMMRGEVGGRLRQERQRLGLNQTEFAAIADVSKASQVNYESGERSPDADYLAEIADRVDVLYVLTGRREGQAKGGVLDEWMLTAILEALDIWEAESGQRLEVATRARLLALFYSHALNLGGTLPTDWMRETIRMVAK